jgi:hypothetical protein
MQRSLRQSAPVVTFLSPSSAASRRMLDTVQQWTGLEEITKKTDKDDALDEKFGMSKLLGVAGSVFIKWDSVALQSEKGTILHWLSVADANDRPNNPMELLAIHGNIQTVQEVRAKLAQQLGKTSAAMLLNNFTGRHISAQHLLKERNGLPVLDFSIESRETGERREWKLGDVKEVVISTSDEDTTLFSMLSQSPGLSRAVTGLYQSNNQASLCIRPLPIAKEDRAMPPPSLVFHTLHLDETCKSLPDDTKAFKIGYTGENGLTNCEKTSFGRVQVILRNESVYGIDVCFCSNVKPSSMIAEAQEWLLASSLAELQSKHVVSDAQDEVDLNTNNADYYADFQATVKNPKYILQPLEEARMWEYLP